MPTSERGWQYGIQQNINAAARCLKDLRQDMMKPSKRASHIDQLRLHVSGVQAYIENQPSRVKKKFLDDTNCFVRRALGYIPNDLGGYLAFSSAQGGALGVSQHVLEKNFPEVDTKLPQHLEHFHRPMNCDVLKKEAPQKNHPKPVEVIDLTADRPNSRRKDSVTDRQCRECVSSEYGADLVAAALDVRDAILWYDPEEDLDQDMLP